MSSDETEPPMKIDNRVNVLGGPASTLPLIICFHGSGDSCASWRRLADILSSTYRVLLWDRGECNPKPSASVKDMLEALDHTCLSPPYILIAHSYGGTFAREFLQHRLHDVAGMVLVETGQETALNPKVEQQQYKRKILGDKPLSVIRGNTLINKWQQYEEVAALASSDSERASLVIQKQFLDAADQEDERLKKAQLQLSRNSHYVHLPDCGHGVVQDRPDVVAAEVQGVVDNLWEPAGRKGILQSLSAFVRSLRALR